MHCGGPRTYGTESDAELVSAIVAGDESAFEELMSRYRELMYSVCRRITCDDSAAADAVQEALIAVWRKIGSFQGRSAISTWLFRIASNSAVDEVRRRAARREQDYHLDESRSGGRDVEATAVVRSSVDWALAQLPPQFRAAVVLREYYDFGYQEIANILGVPIDTVKSRISRGRQALRDLLMPGFRGDFRID